MDDGESPGIGIVDARLLGRELVFDQLIFDAIIGERAGGVEAERTKVAGQNLHGRNAASLDRLDEFRAGREWEILAAPQAEPLGIGEIVNRGRAGGRDIDDAGVGQRVLEAKPGTSLLRGCDIAAFALAPRRILHGMAFIEDDDAVEIRAEPIDDLAHAGRLFAALVGAQRGIGREQDAFGQPDVLALRKARQRRDKQAFHAEGRPVALSVFQQLVGFGDPDGLAAAVHPVVEDDPGRLAALARAGAVAEHKASTEADGVRGIVGRGRDEIEGFVERPRTGEEVRMGLAGIDHRFQLRVGEDAVGDDVGRQPRPVAGPGRRDRGHGGRLHQLGRMGLRARNTDRLQSVFFIDGISDAAVLGRGPVHGLIDQLDAFGFDGRTRGRGCGSAGQIAANGFRCGRGSDGNRDRRIDRQARRNMLADPAHQRGRVRRDPDRSREDGRIVGGQFVDDGQPRVDGRAVLGIDRTVDRGGEHHAAMLLKPGEGVPPGRHIRSEARPGDGDEPPAIGQTRQCRGDMTIGGVGHSAGDVRHHREWRVHQHNARHDAGIEMVVDLGRVEARGGTGRKEMRKKIGARVGQFVQHQCAAGDLGQDGEQTRSGRRFENAVGGRDGGGGCSDQAERDRRRELR